MDRRQRSARHADTTRTTAAAIATARCGRSASRRHAPAHSRPVLGARKPTSGFRGPRAPRGPASVPAPLRTPRIFVSSRRRRHPLPRLLFALLLWTVALTALVTAVA
jgi:hypothetical protein